MLVKSKAGTTEVTGPKRRAQLEGQASNSDILVAPVSLVSGHCRPLHSGRQLRTNRMVCAGRPVGCYGRLHLVCLVGLVATMQAAQSAPLVVQPKNSYIR